MNRLLVIIVFMLSVNSAFSQKYMDEIAEKSCNCVSNLPESVEPENYTMELGLCMIKVSMPYKKQLKKDFEIDMDNIAENGEKLGGIIGSRMVGVCPDELILMTKKSKEINESEEIISNLFEGEGIVEKIENSYFITFYIKSEDGKTNRFLWMDFIETKEDLAYDFKLLEGKKVSLTYSVKEFFDPKILDYRNFYIIKKIDLLD